MKRFKAGRHDWNESSDDDDDSTTDVRKPVARYQGLVAERPEPECLPSTSEPTEDKEERTDACEIGPTPFCEPLFKPFIDDAAVSRHMAGLFISAILVPPLVEGLGLNG